METGIVDGHVIAFQPECPLGRRWVEAAVDRQAEPTTEVAGARVEVDAAVARAADLLGAARRPVIYGLRMTTTESVRAVLALADRLGALVLVDRTAAEMDRLATFQNSGRVSATLGEVKARADLVVFWGVDPLATHPRHAERYSVGPPSRFLPGGRADRTVVVIGEAGTQSAASADLVIPLPASADVPLLVALRMLTGSSTADPAALAGTCGLEGKTLRDLVERLLRARYAAVFFQPRRDLGQSTRSEWEAVTGLVRDLNRTTRAVLMSLGSSDNLPGAEAALTWQAGFPGGIDFGRGYPKPVDERTTLEAVLADRETDALLVVAAAFPEGLSRAAVGHFGTIPVVVIAPGAASRTWPQPAVSLESGTCGIDVRGTVTRSDGVVLPVRPLRDLGCPGDREWIEGIARALGERPGQGTCSISPTVRTDA